MAKYLQRTFNRACLFQEELLRCTACCEPFHPFCLSYDELPQSAEVEREWVCRRCAACQVCGRADGDGDKLRCGKCLKASHSDCLQPSQRETIPGQDGGDESWVSLANTYLKKDKKRSKLRLLSSPLSFFATYLI